VALRGHIRGLVLTSRPVFANPVHLAVKPASRTGCVAFPVKCLKSRVLTKFTLPNLAKTPFPGRFAFSFKKCRPAEPMLRSSRFQRDLITST
jgi:hypothetical protein